MKKIVLTFGLISGAITALMMFVTLPLIGRVSFEKMEIVGYTTIVVSFLMVFFGIRSYRETVGGGRISFAQALKVGLLITLISSACYVLAWQIIYYKITPDFVDKYGDYMVEKARSSGATPEELATERQRMETFKEWYKNPLINVAITLMEPLPIGVLITLISSLILRRREPKTEASEVKV
jgi:Protein of unknown function (DUF4199)